MRMDTRYNVNEMIYDTSFISNPFSLIATEIKYFYKTCSIYNRDIFDIRGKN